MSKPSLPACLLLAACFFLPALSAEEVPAVDSAERTRMTRLQIFLHAKNFGPGRIDGLWGEFTRKSLARYQKAEGKDVPEFGEEPPGSLDLPLDESSSATTEYKIAAEDVKRIGSVPESPEKQSEQKSMPYESLLELVAERFHADPEFVRELNPDKQLGDLAEGDTLRVPNVKDPFKIGEAEKRAESGKEEAGKENADEEAAEKKDSGAAKNEAKIRIRTGEKMLEVLRGDKLVAAFPITPGSESLPAPKGEWKIVSVAWMPWFRYDEKMLKEGKRSDTAHNLPPGPNSPVGIVWMALDSKGIGIHGTNDPDSIGRSSSHGCIRLSNWDAWTLGNMVSEETAVLIE